jgi:hypothetical protein
MSPECPLPFRESLPSYARTWCWFPKLTLTLCLDLPTGEGTLFQVYWCPQTGQFAYNVAHVRTGAP